MKILGIDPGYGLCGFAMIDHHKKQEKLMTFGVIKTDSKADFGARLKEIGEDIEQVIENYKPDVVVMEDLFFAKNVTTAMKVSAVRGVIHYITSTKGLEMYEPKPNEIKQAFCGNGGAKKAEMQRMAQLRFKLEKKPHIDDAADAIAVACWGAQNIAFLRKL